jgi:hypothetical protein
MPGRIGTLSVAFLWLLLFCAKKAENPRSTASPDLFFHVDSTRIDPAVLDAGMGLHFCPPKGWEPVSSGVFAEFRKTIQSEFPRDQMAAVDPLHIYLKKENQGFLAVSRFHGVMGTSGVRLFLKEYSRLLAAKFGADRVRKGGFFKDEIEFSQFLIRADNRIMFKLIFSNAENQRIQFDYIVPEAVYPIELKAIESSIGSIELIHSAGRRLK